MRIFTQDPKSWKRHTYSRAFGRLLSVQSSARVVTSWNFLKNMAMSRADASLTCVLIHDHSLYASLVAALLVDPVRSHPCLCRRMQADFPCVHQGRAVELLPDYRPSVSTIFLFALSCLADDVRHVAVSVAGSVQRDGCTINHLPVLPNDFCRLVSMTFTFQACSKHLT